MSETGKISATLEAAPPPPPCVCDMERVPVVDQTAGSSFKKACDEMWVEICGDDTVPLYGIEPCGFVALVAGEETVPTTREDVSALGSRLCDMDYMVPRVRSMMEEVVAARKAYFTGDLSKHVHGECNAMHAICGLVGQWEIASRVGRRSKKEGGEGSQMHFLHNIQVATSHEIDGSSMILYPTENDFLKPSDPPNVREWLAEERPFRNKEGVSHFVQRDNEVLSLADWSLEAAQQVQEGGGGVSMIVDGWGHYWVYMITCIGGRPTVLRLDSLNHPPEPEPRVKAVCAALGLTLPGK